MSSGPKITLAAGQKLAARIIEAVGPAHGLEVAGSIRRQAEHVGDLDLIAPAPPDAAWDDRLHNALASLCFDHGRQRQSGLFDPEQEARPKLFRVRSGLNPGFRTVQLEYVASSAGVVFPVQIHRYTPTNAGWIRVMRTGPADFNVMVLVEWKKAFGIDSQADASVQGNLVDQYRQVVPVPTEQDVFAKARMSWIAPEDRERAVVVWKSTRRF